MLKKGSIPITIFVIAVIALYIFAILLFYLGANNQMKTVNSGYKYARLISGEIDARSFLKLDEPIQPQIKTKSKLFGLLGKEDELVIRYTRRVVQPG